MEGGKGVSMVGGRGYWFFRGGVRGEGGEMIDGGRREIGGKWIRGEGGKG